MKDAISKMSEIREFFMKRDTDYIYTISDVDADIVESKIIEVDKKLAEKKWYIFSPLIPPASLSSCVFSYVQPPPPLLATAPLPPPPPRNTPFPPSPQPLSFL
jgi:hypothetical protein